MGQVCGCSEALAADQKPEQGLRDRLPGAREDRHTWQNRDRRGRRDQDPVEVRPGLVRTVPPGPRRCAGRVGTAAAGAMSGGQGTCPAAHGALPEPCCGRHRLSGWSSLTEL